MTIILSIFIQLTLSEFPNIFLLLLVQRFMKLLLRIEVIFFCYIITQRLEFFHLFCLSIFVVIFLYLIENEFRMEDVTFGALFEALTSLKIIGFDAIRDWDVKVLMQDKFSFYVPTRLKLDSPFPFKEFPIGLAGVTISRVWVLFYCYFLQ